NELPIDASFSPQKGRPDDEKFNRLIALAEENGTARVIVGVHSAFVPEGRLVADKMQKQRSSIKQSQKELLRRLNYSGLRDVKEFEYIPYLAFETDAATLKRMRGESLVFSIEEDIIGAPGLAESTAMIGAPAAWASGYTGRQQTVAILDSGVDQFHGFLFGKVIAESCYSSNVPGTATSFCPGGATESTLPQSGLNCPAEINGCGHGTHLAGTAAGRGAAFSGVAKDAGIISIQIFSKFETAASCGGTPAPCARYYTSDLIRGLERIRTLADTMSNIAAVNLSLQTGQQYASNCDAAHSATKAAIDNLRSINIATTACSGNYSFANALTAPACISSAISVGSVGDGSLGAAADTVAETSDSSPLLHLLAPGRWINSSVPGGGFQSYTGTSMATAHVSGALAILRQRSPNATIERMLNALINTGRPITDSRNGVVKPRIAIDKAVQAVAFKAPFDYDGDGKSDVSVFRPSNGVWHLLQSQSGYTGFQFGIASDRSVAADYDGDGRTDAAVYRDGIWHILRSSLGYTGFAFGIATDIPVPADYDGDGKADAAVYREGIWHILGSRDGYRGFQFGVATDKPVPADYDGDGKTDAAVYRDGVWHIFGSTVGYTGYSFGIATDKPVVADYDGDGKADPSVYREGIWHILRSQSGYTGFGFGISTDIPTPADYDGDGRADVAVFRDGNWYIIKSAANQFHAVQFGIAGDKPVPAAFVP
ncbi:MAG TPA: S8 family serine peptidase, partial [Pyrinomonadaceae bacterium]